MLAATKGFIWTGCNLFSQGAYVCGSISPLLFISAVIPGFSGGSVVKNSPAKAWIQFQGQEDSLEEEMETHSSILAWRILWIEETGGL